MDPTTGRIQARIGDVTAYPIDFGDGAVWYSGDGKVGRIDPATNTASKTFDVAPGKDLSNMAFAGGYGWVTEASEGNLYKIDRTGLKDVIKLRPGIGTPAATSGAVWLSNNRDGTLTGVDDVTSETRTIDTGHATLSIATGENQLMVAVGPTADDVIGGLEGSVLTLTTEGFPWDDPYPESADQLVVRGSRGRVPHLPRAAELPGQAQPRVPSSSRRLPPRCRRSAQTDDIHVHGPPGFAFPPPVERAGDRRDVPVVDRAGPLAGPDRLGTRKPVPLDDIVGAQAFRDGKASTVAGLSADGDRLTIRLVAPSTDFLERLSLPFYCAVPAGTPPALLGIDSDPPSSRGRAVLPQPENPPEAGGAEEEPELPRRPSQPLPMPSRSRSRASQSDLLAAVKSGQVDGAMLDASEPLVGPGGDLDLAWGPGSDAAAAGDQRWFGAGGVGVCPTSP